ncbi:hypothetical protein K1Y78_64025, partial [Streptomyces sp. tea 10]|nr:hypothetical protein [Streptomyces sp. tea 10]
MASQDIPRPRVRPRGADGAASGRANVELPGTKGQAPSVVLIAGMWASSAWGMESGEDEYPES